MLRIKASYSIDLNHNNFDFLRLFFASMVFMVHVHDLSGVTEFEWIRRYFSAKFAVESFFIISGFLIVMSYEKTSSLHVYFSKRIRRIYPAYFTVILICAVFGFFISDSTFFEYFSADWLKYIFYNMIFLNFIHGTLPGIFVNNIVQEVNGALWTIKIEVMFYVLVPLFVWLIRKTRKLPVLAIFYALAFLYKAYFEHLALFSGNKFYDILAKQLPGQLMFFMAGAACFYYRKLIFNYSTIVLLIVILSVFFKNNLVFGYFYPLGLALLIMWCAYCVPVHIDLSRFGDASYGVYIFHFPILQTVVTAGLYKNYPYLAFVVSIAVLMAVAYMSWHFIEKPMLASNATHFNREN